MTTSQLIAMLFPVGTAIAVTLTGLLVKKVWVDRPTGQKPEPSADVLTVEVAAIEEAILVADELVERAHRGLQQAQRNLRTPSL